MNRALAFVLVAAVVGCSQAPSGGDSAVTTAPREEAKPVQFETTPLQVAAASVKEQDPAVLAAAEWTAKQCSLTLPDMPDNQLDLDAAGTGPTHLAGFFIAPADQPAGDFEVVLKGEAKNYSFPVKTGWDRTDVADFFKMPQLASAGYDVMVDLSGVDAGKYKINYMVDRSGKKFFCESGRNLVVKASAAAAAEAVVQPAMDEAVQPAAN